MDEKVFLDLILEGYSLNHLDYQKIELRVGLGKNEYSKEWIRDDISEKSYWLLEILPKIIKYLAVLGLLFFQKIQIRRYK